MSTPTPSPDLLARMLAVAALAISVWSLWLHVRRDKRETAKEQRELAEYEAKKRATVEAVSFEHRAVIKKISPTKVRHEYVVRITNSGGKSIPMPEVRIIVHREGQTDPDVLLRTSDDYPEDHPSGAVLSWYLDCRDAVAIKIKGSDVRLSVVAMSDGRVIATDDGDAFQSAIQQVLEATQDRCD